MAQENPYAKYREQSQPVPIAQIKPIIAAPVDPNKQAQEARAQAGEIRAEQSAALQQAANARAEAAAAREQARFEKEMTGAGRKPLREGDAQKLTDDVSSVEALERALNSFQDDFVGLTADVENVAQGVAGVGTPGQRDWWADFRATDNLIRNQLFGASLTAGEKSAYSSTTITPRMSPDEVRRNLQRRLEIARKAAARRFDRLNAAGYNPDEVAAIVGEVDIKTPVEQRIAQQEPEQLALQAGERFSTDQDKAIAAAVQQAWASGADVQGLAAAAEAAGGTVTPADIEAFQQAVEARAQRQPVTFTPAQSGQRSALQQAAGEFLMTPVGTALTGAVNATGAGLLSQVAGDQIQGLEALNPAAGLTGEVVGSALGTAGLAKGAAAGLKAVAPSMASRLAGGGAAGAIGREALTEGAYGGLYAANTGEDIGTGIALGAGGSLAGRAVGAGLQRTASPTLQRIGNFLNRADGGPTPPDGGVPPMGGGPDVPPGGGVPPAGGAMGGAAEAGVPPMGGGAAMGGAEEPFIPSTSRFSSGGAMGVSDEGIRVNRARELPVPIELAKFQRSRLFEEQQRARDLAKNNEVGGPIRELLKNQQEALRQNFDAFLDKTGSREWGNRREQGKVVDEALETLRNRMKIKVRALYKRAEKAGEMAEPVDMSGLADELNKLRAERRAAPVIEGLSDELDVREFATGSLNDGTLKMKRPLTLNEAEELRKKINRVAKQNDPNDLRVAGELKNLIDSLTENSGGDAYKAARAARKEVGDKFERITAVKRILAKKPGTTDRQIALEHVVDTAVTSSRTSLDDVKALKSVLNEAGPRGQRAWRELQGAALEYIRKKAYRSQTDESGQVVLYPSQLEKVIDDLDMGGKLDFVFGKKNAELLRAMSEVSKDLFTAPPGAVNTSNTGSAVVNAMDTMVTFMMAGAPVPAGKLTNELFKSLRTRGLRQEVKRLIATPETN